MKKFKLISFFILSLIIPLTAGSHLKFTEKIIVFFVSFVGCWISNLIKLIFMPDFVIGTSGYVLGKQLYWSIGIYLTGALLPGVLLADMYSEENKSSPYQNVSFENEEINLEEIYNARDKSKLYLLDESELRILRNYPFAKEGYRFKDTELKEYFENQSWYEPNSSLSNEEISKSKKDDEWFIYMKKYMEFSSYDK